MFLSMPKSKETFLFFFHRFEITSHLKGTLLYMFQFLVGYFLMLVAMTYNVWLFLAVVVGCGIGFFLVDPSFEYYFSQHKKRVCKSIVTRLNNKDSVL